ncbi:hypothetical protein BpHYR1_052207 [Brachionus plicatilis]|uniref:Uncharacterized protein n=1 Tax=Brachionus plicatilis TaxID=10195 RepID=A0A3M7S4L9_BRAPC|nr:hypothetical protein BpHYR1_052207 [Brachionus plicatilis]
MFSLRYPISISNILLYFNCIFFIKIFPQSFIKSIRFSDDKIFKYVYTFSNSLYGKKLLSNSKKWIIFDFFENFKKVSMLHFKLINRLVAMINTLINLCQITNTAVLIRIFLIRHKNSQLKQTLFKLRTF